MSNELSERSAPTLFLRTAGPHMHCIIDVVIEAEKREMPPKIAYPRTCDRCKGVYSSRASFCNHQRQEQGSSSCDRKYNCSVIAGDQQSGGINLVCRDSNNITINNHGLPDWLDAKEFKGFIEQIKAAVALLEKIGIKGLQETDTYLRANQLTHDDYMSLLKDRTQQSKLEATISDIADRAAALKPRSYIQALDMFFTEIFWKESGIEVSVDSYKTRCINLENKNDSICDMLKYTNSNSENDDCILEFRKAHWNQLIIDILWRLSSRFLAYMKDGYQPFDYIEERAEEKVKFQEGYIAWAKSITSARDLSDDKYIKILIQKISNRIMKDCRDDVWCGWRRLIEYLSVLHASGKIDINEDREKKSEARKRLKEIHDEIDDMQEDGMSQEQLNMVAVKYKEMAQIRKEANLTDDPQDWKDNKISSIVS